jgi:thioredoxin domain-containing protein 5
MLALKIATFFILLVLQFLSSQSEVIVLDSKNFEHLTQVSTGSTTGDWLVKFYAPWCGHCKKLEPIYEKVAEALEGEVNVGKVDVTASRELGTRFDIKGFPTILLFSKGKAYTFKGRRTVEDFVEFAKGGYQIHEPEEVQPPAGMFGELIYIYRHAYKQAGTDLRKGNFFTIDVFLTFLPLLFVILLVVVLFAPTPSPRRPRDEDEEEEEEEPPKSQSIGKGEKSD